MAPALSPAPVSTSPTTRPKYLSGLKIHQCHGPLAHQSRQPVAGSNSLDLLRPACAGDLRCIDAQKPHPRDHLLAEPEMDKHLDSVAIDNLHQMGASGPCQRSARPDTGMADRACWHRRIRDDSAASARRTMVTVHQPIAQTSDQGAHPRAGPRQAPGPPASAPDRVSSPGPSCQAGPL